jgi:starch phosphorylase
MSLSEEADLALARGGPADGVAASAFGAAAAAVRGPLLEQYWRTQRSMDGAPKRLAYMSLEFLLGRFLRNAALNVAGGEAAAAARLARLGAALEDACDAEPDAALGNGGLGRLAACFMDSLATLRLPAVGYGVRYDYGIFRQALGDGGAQIELPDDWLPAHGGPHAFEVFRPELRVQVALGGAVSGDADALLWAPDTFVDALPYDQLVPGFRCGVALPVRLWRAVAAPPAGGFDLAAFNAGHYEDATAAAARAADISRVLYPNDNHARGKELRLKQQYFFVSASLQDVLRSFRTLVGPIASHVQWNALPDFVAVQLNDTHPTLAVPELMRLLVYMEGLPWVQAWDVCRRVFAYTNHTVLPEALEKWDVELLQAVLPMHLEIIFRINHFFLEELRASPLLASLPDDHARGAFLERVSVIEERPTRRVRMAHLAILGSHAVNGVAAIHSKILVEEVFRDHCRLWPERFQNKTNGVTIRRWVHQANPRLAALLSRWLGGDAWLTDHTRAATLEAKLDDPAAVADFQAVKAACKLALVEHMRRTAGAHLLEDALYDVQIKRIHEYKRQLLNILGVIHRYLRIKETAPVDRARLFVPRVVLFGGKAAPGYFMAKLIIRLIGAVARVVARDADVAGLLQVVFVPNYCVSLAERLIPAADLSEQISTAGMEASGTGNMKFVLNGAAIVGTLDGANVEIAERVGSDNIFIFGARADEVAALRPRYKSAAGADEPLDRAALDPRFVEVLETLESGRFAAPAEFEPVVYHLLHNDFYLVAHDFGAYLDAQRAADDAFRDCAGFARIQLANVLRSFDFSSDRTIQEYVRDIWGIRPMEN